MHKSSNTIILLLSLPLASLIIVVSCIGLFTSELIILNQTTYFPHGILGGVDMALIILGLVQKQLYNADK